MHDEWAFFRDMPAVITANRERAARTGRAEWFGQREMRFFGTACESPVIAGCLFICSHQPPEGPRFYAVHRAMPSGEISDPDPDAGMVRHGTLANAVTYALAYAIGQGWAFRDVTSSAMLHAGDMLHPNTPIVAALIDSFGRGAVRAMGQA